MSTLSPSRVARWLDTRAEKALAYYAANEGTPIAEPYLSAARWLRFHIEDANCIEPVGEDNIIRLTPMGRNVLSLLQKAEG